MDSVERLSQYLAENSVHREKARPTVHKLEKRIDMRTQGLSSTIALSGNVDLESAKKGMVRTALLVRVVWLTYPDRPPESIWVNSPKRRPS